MSNMPNSGMVKTRNHIQNNTKALLMPSSFSSWLQKGTLKISLCRILFYHRRQKQIRTNQRKDTCHGIGLQQCRLFITSASPLDLSCTPKTIDQNIQRSWIFPDLAVKREDLNVLVRDNPHTSSTRYHADSRCHLPESSKI